MTSYMLTQDIVDWAAQECHRQRSGEISVSDMVRAWFFAVDRCHRHFAEEDVLCLGGLIEPDVNAQGYRQTPVLLSSIPALHHDAVPRAMQQLLDNQSSLSAHEFFRMFEEIHPFRDGNGRVGSILYNWMTHMLATPIAPPDLWKNGRM